MTCIVGLVSGGKVYLGGDSAGYDHQNMHIRVHAEPKVFRNRDFLIGYTTSFRMGQLLRYVFVPPAPPASPAKLAGFMVSEFIDAVRNCFKGGGFASKDRDVEAGGTFLVGVKGRLFEVQDYYHVCEVEGGFNAVGCGYQPALGALHVTANMPPRKRILTALKTAEKFSMGVRGPFHLVSG